MLLLDKRGGSGPLYEPLKSKLNGQVKLAMLRSPDGEDVGDVCWEGNGADGDMLVGAEVKSLGDMLASMRNDRYVDQLNRMLDCYGFIYLLVYGIFRPDDHGILEVPSRDGWHALGLVSREQKKRGVRRGRYYYSELDSFICSLEAKRGVRVRRCSNQTELVATIVDLYRWWQKPWDEHKSVEAIKCKTLGLFARKESLARMVAAQLPGIGWGRSKEVALKFGTVERMAQASEEEWLIKGVVGPKTAAAVWEALRKKEK